MQEDGYGCYPVMFEFYRTPAGHITLFVGEKEVAKGTGHGFDKAGVALGQWVRNEFAAELKEIFDKPKNRKLLAYPHNGNLPDGTRNPWFCVLRDEKTGYISINGMSGLSHVIEIMERSVGLTLRLVGRTKTSTIYLLARNRPHRER